MVRKKPGRKAEPPTKRGIAWPRWTGFRNKTVWDVLQLLIVPLMLAAIGFWFTAQQDQHQQQIENQRAQQAQKIENQRAEAERELAEQRAQDEALQGYLDQMSNLLLEKDLRTSDEGSEARTLARARTLTVLGRLDPEHKEAAMQFLLEARLVQSSTEEPVITVGDVDLSNPDRVRIWSNSTVSEVHLPRPYIMQFLRGSHLVGSTDGGDSVIALTDADLNNTELAGTDLSGANLWEVNLEDAILIGTDLSGADLGGADLSGAYLSQANLSRAFLYGADLSDADLSGDADLSAGTNLSGAILISTDLSDVKLDGANLDRAILVGSNVSEEKLTTCGCSLEGATMPNGQKYEDWLKSKDREVDGENSSAE